MNEEVDKEIAELRRKLTALQQLKAKAKKPTQPKMPKLPKGRPPINPAILYKARELAKDFPLPDVALQLNISLSTLYHYGIKRYRLNAEAALNK